MVKTSWNHVQTDIPIFDFRQKKFSGKHWQKVGHELGFIMGLEVIISGLDGVN